MKKTIIALVAAALTFGCSVAAQAEQGVIALIAGNKMVVEDDLGEYTCAEIYSGWLCNEGDIIYGDLHTYGMQDWYDDTSGEEITVYVDDYWQNADQAIYYLRG